MVTVIFALAALLLILAMMVYASRLGLVDSQHQIPSWDEELPDIASNHTQVAGLLAGFTTTVVVLLAGFKLAANSKAEPLPLEQATVGLFMIAFFGYVGTGILFSVSIERRQEQRYFLFSTASQLYYLSVVLSFAALLPLCRLLNYNFLEQACAYMVVGSTVGGYLAAAVPQFDLLRVHRRFIVILFLAAVATALALANASKILDVTKLLPIALPAGVTLVSLVFTVCMFSFYVNPLGREQLLVKLALVFAYVVASLAVYMATLSVTFGS
jgi:hypothetical protein